MPIIFAPINTQLRVVRIAADDKTKKRLESLGIAVNSSITVMSSGGGSVVCRVLDGKLALDRDLSTKIFVV